MDLELLYIGLFAICGCVFFILFLTCFQQAVHHGGHIGAGVDVVEVFDTERSIMSSGDDAGNPTRSSLACHSRSNYFVRRLSRSLTAERSALIMPSIVREFSFEQIEAATDKFANSNIIKQGHSGDIYKGVLEGGEVVVIKRICTKLPANKEIMVNSSNGYCDQLSMKDSYFAEMDIYGKVLDQSFLVPVLGQCLAKEDKFLVYEYMSFGDLASILARGRANTTHNVKPAEKVALKDEEVGMEYSEEEGSVRVDVEGGGAADFQACPMLTWPVRMRIAREVAEALVYLHHESRPPLSHRNIQGSSIFFNKDFEVKLGSLGDAQKIESGEVPAYDIYCYGKLLLDLISGLDISGSYRDEEAQAWISMCFHAVTNVTPVAATLPSTKVADHILQLIDRNLLLQDHHLLDIIQVANLAKLCMEPPTLQKLSMKRVLELLPLLSN